MAYNGNYVSNADVRGEGVAASIPDDKIDRAIKSAELMVENITRRWFYRKRAVNLILDGGDRYVGDYGGFPGLTTGWQFTGILFLSIPVIQLTAININNHAADVNDFVLMNRIGIPTDDRFNPRIISKKIEIPTFGVANISLTGDFGFVENYDTYDTPELIKTATLKLAVNSLLRKKMTDSGRDVEWVSGMIVEEETPGYRYRLSSKLMESRLTQNIFTGDNEVDDILEMYRYKTLIQSV